jgi:hypothetical protein
MTENLSLRILIMEYGDCWNRGIPVTNRGATTSPEHIGLAGLRFFVMGSVEMGKPFPKSAFVGR